MLVCNLRETQRCLGPGISTCFVCRQLKVCVFLHQTSGICLRLALLANSRNFLKATSTVDKSSVLHLSGHKIELHVRVRHRYFCNIITQVSVISAGTACTSVLSQRFSSPVSSTSLKFLLCNPANFPAGQSCWHNTVKAILIVSICGFICLIILMSQH